MKLTTINDLKTKITVLNALQSHRVYELGQRNGSFAIDYKEGTHAGLYTFLCGLTNKECKFALCGLIEGVRTA